MADPVISYLLDNLTRLISHESDLLLGVEDRVRSLQDELKFTQTFLQSFREKRNEATVMAEFTSQIRDAAREAEDIIDAYVTNVAQHIGENMAVRLKGKLEHIFARRKVSDEIERVRKRFEEIHKNRERFCIHPGGDVPAEDDTSLRRRRLLVEETDVVGFDSDARTILDRLTKGESRRDVVSIVGMGGIGKTTLARKVFNDPIVASYFDFRAWIYVSEGYRVRDLLQAIVKRALALSAESMKEMSDDELTSELIKYLRSTRYLIVLDDVWKTEFWHELNHVFANNSYGSRIILTTRHKAVALHVNSISPPHDMHFLSKEESWELFSKKVFPGGSCPADLEELGKQMADKCRGLPLAIVVLAGVLLKKEKTSRWWTRVSSSVDSLLSEHTALCSDILALSYNNLPPNLKPCFLYFGLFPKDSEIPARRLVRLWIAEGFVQKRDGETMESTGEDYLEELVARNLIQVSKRRSDRTTKTCCIHDLLQDLCILKAKEDGSLQTLGNESCSLQPSSRHLGLHSNRLKYILSIPSPPKLRSILCFGLDETQLSSKEWKLIKKCIPLVRVLDLWAYVVDVIPDHIEKLVNIRYLRLKSLTAQTFPSSISNLWNLQTLEVAAPCIDRPLIDIWKMKELRHLHFRGQVVLREPPKDMINDPENCLYNLQTLASISPDSCLKSVFSKLPNLLKLGIHGDLERHKNHAFKHLSGLTSVQTLKLERDSGRSELSSLRYGFKYPPNLTKLTLLETELLEDPMDVLGKLSNLQVLKLKNKAYGGRDLNCPSNRFPKLQVLKLVNLAIRSWTISAGSMLCLRSVVINRCSNLGGLPSTLPTMPTFQELELWSPSVQLVREAREIEMARGEDQFTLTIYQT